MSAPQSNTWPMSLQIRYPAVTECDVAPDNRRVVYTVREPLLGDERSAYITHLYLAAPGQAPVRLTQGRHSNRCPRWSPDGRTIAFLSNRGGQVNLYAMRVDGGEAWPLTAVTDHDITTFAWAPDGRSLAALLPAPPTDAHRLARQTGDDALRWDIDLTFAHLYRVPFDTATEPPASLEPITTGRFHVVAFDWFPDGSRLAITHRPHTADQAWIETTLALVPVDGRAHGPDEVTNLASLCDWAAQPRVSPDGRFIAAVTGDQPPRWAFSARVVVYSAESSSPHPLAYTPDGNCLLLGWQADGQGVVVLEETQIDTQLWALPVSGAPGRALTTTPSLKEAARMNHHGAVAFADETFTQPHTVRLFDTADASLQHVADPHLPADWPTVPLPEARVVRWDSADGRSIEGIVVYPTAYEPGRRYPLVVEIHGGPSGVFQRNYLGVPERYADVLGLAERGCVVLRPNPRGSGGYGCDFRFANYHDWGGGDFQDIMRGVDRLIADGVVNEEQMGILGWSYGGYMTSWAITQTNRFRAACVGAGVTNLMSFNGTADIPGFVPDYFGAEFWDDLEPYRRHSPLFRIAGATTPTLIQHGAEDIRVPLSQGRELYNALRRQGVPVELVIYPRQGHAVTEPRLKIDVRERATAWLLRWMGVDSAEST